MAKTLSHFIHVILLNGLKQVFTYQVPLHQGFKCVLGMRVIVPFKNSLKAGIIVHVYDEHPDYEVKSVLAIPDRDPIFSSRQMRWLQWLSSYYLCPLASIIKASLGSLTSYLTPIIRLSSNYNPELIYDQESKKILNSLDRYSKVTFEEVSVLLGEKVDYVEVLYRLLEKKAITVADSLTVHLPQITYVKLARKYLSTGEIDVLKETLRAYPKQKAVLDAYLSQIYQVDWFDKRSVAKKTLLKKNISPSSLKTLVKGGILLEGKSVHFPPNPTNINLPNLTSDQKEVLASIDKQWEQRRVVLLKGSSQEELRSLSLEVLRKGLAKGQVLYLLPTIKQVVLLHAILKKRLGYEDVCVYDAQCTKLEKLRVWCGVQRGKVRFILGTRSALFLPFEHLACIIVGREHHEVYKQTFRPPFFHTRDAGIVLAKYYSAKVLITSTTPSLVSYYHAHKKRYGCVVLRSSKKCPPVGLTLLPKIKNQSAAGYHELSPTLVQLLKEAFKENKQVILLHSRKGYAAYTVCGTCKWQAICSNCNHYLVYHQTSRKLHCHHCSHLSTLPSHCPKCKSTSLQHRTIGTQQVEELLQIYFPYIAIKRLDGDNTPSYAYYLNVLAEFKEKKIPVLIATPALIDFLPLGKPCLVVILDLENWLNRPSFSAYEKTYQALAQLSQPTLSTRLLVQITNYENKPMQFLIHNIFKSSHEAIYERMLSERYNYSYPPYTRLIKVCLSSDHSGILHQAIHHIGKMYQNDLGLSIVGPTLQIKNLNKRYTAEIWIKLSKNKELDSIKKKIVAQTSGFLKKSIYRSFSLSFDVDPI